MLAFCSFEFFLVAFVVDAQNAKRLLIKVFLQLMNNLIS